LKYARNIAFISLISVIDLPFLIKKGVSKGDKTLLIIKTDGIGDYVLFRNFLGAVRTSDRFKDFKITLLGDDKFKDMAEYFDGDYVDEFVWFDRSRFCNKLAYHYKNLINFRRKRVSVVLQANMSRNFMTDRIAKFINAGEKIAHVGEPCYDTRRVFRKHSNRWYTNLVATTEGAFEFNRNKEFFEKILGRTIPISRPSFDDARLRQIGFDFKKYAIDGDFIVVTPGSGELWKNWSPDNFSEVCSFILSMHKGMKVAICGSTGDSEAAGRISLKLPAGSTTDLCGKTSVCELAAILSRAKLLVSCDTGAVHLAAALGTPTVCVSSIGDRHFGRFIPYPKEVFDRQICIFHPIIESIVSNLPQDNKLFYTGPILNVNEISWKTVVERIEKFQKANYHSYA
jgi:ADP-heptose:LPS heptosyltransferase